MSLAIFDLDKTLLSGDSDFLWGEFLIEVGAVNPCTYQLKNQEFFDDYAIGKLDINKYLKFCLEPLSKYSMKKLNFWRDEFIKEKIKPIITKKAFTTVEKHKNNGDTLLVITATNQFVAEKIVKLFKIPNLIATGIEIKNNQYTGNLVGIPCFQDGKITNLNLWLKDKNYSLKNSFFYSDSVNDLPMLELVDTPIVVNGDTELLKIAKKRHWQCENWLS